MAFVDPTKTAGVTTTSNTAAAGVKDKRTTIGFVNLYVPLADGTRMKLSPELTLRLYAENALDVKLIEALKSGALTPEKLKELIIVEITQARDKDAPIEFAIEL